ncbi:hypothetical protein QJS10_CPA03g01218 [Acorus calamus]|uniref:Uncharacterized protein n=1 Tax=Acorus calamus TaxID=4465 RepID=A0AAV9F8Z9_ACOCL|nr:hypothetical protein QJS10_CPA03g01218 [Acorus calamus]
MPKGIGMQIDRLRRRFLWQGVDTVGRKPALVKWSTLSFPREVWGVYEWTLPGDYSASHNAIQGMFGDGQTLSEVIMWELGDGSSIRFWEDVWCGNESLQVLFPMLFKVASLRMGADKEFWDVDMNVWVLRLHRELRECESHQLIDCCELLHARAVIDGVTIGCFGGMVLI